MPRRTLARRFEPRCGVSQVALDIESKYVGRELEDQLIQSATVLKEKLAAWESRIAIAEEELQVVYRSLREPENLALRCMLARDCWHIAKLYQSFIRSASLPPALESASVEPIIAMAQQREETVMPSPLLPFKNTLFD